jgi:hypothetical protein
MTTLVEAACDSAPISGLTHNFYRYPARFSPRFVRAAIEAFSEPGDLVLDPFMGGGTTLVEALASGRSAIGTDISSLAAFISEVKTTLHSDAELERLSRWAQDVGTRINAHSNEPKFPRFAKAGYHRHLHLASTWRLRKAISQALATVSRLDSKKLERFARCVVLRTAQWALDGRKILPTLHEFRKTLSEDAAYMIEGARALREAAEATRDRSTTTAKPAIHCWHRSTQGLEAEPRLQGLPRPKVVITSPPYPGIHVLYHRWQVDGRKETAAPFWIANRLDGSGAAYYTMGDRHAHQLKSYYEQLQSALRSIAALCAADTTLVQVVAFSEPDWQLPRYLAVADEAGFAEQLVVSTPDRRDGRLWRTVPRRKWHAHQCGDTHGSKEVVLFHRLKSR